MKSIKGFKNCNILMDNKIIKTNIIINNGLIDKIGNHVCDDLITLDDDLFVVPGFIDEHIHGAASVDFMDKSGYLNILNDTAKSGVTSLCATTTTHSVERIVEVLRSIRLYISKNFIMGSRIIGIHLEGPFISKEYKGAQLEEYIIEPSIDIFNEFINASQNNIKIITVEGKNKEFIKYLKEKGITVSIGHSNATYNEVFDAIEYGVTSITHTYNGMSKVHHRDLGVVGAALLNDELYTELICDGIHVSKEAIMLLVKNKPLDKIVLITDSLRQKGLSDGIYFEDDQNIILKNNKVTLEDGTLAGSILSMNKAIKNIMDYTGVSLIDAVGFATANPAKNLGLFDKIGSISEGKLADFTVIDKDVNVYMTIREGNIIYKKGEE